MNNLALSILSAIVLGLGATLTFDLWGLFLKQAFQIPPSSICLVGRWLLYMREGTFRHTNIRSALPRGAECRLGWIAHYTIGVLFAGAFVTVAGRGWLQQPRPVPAIVFGVVTVVAPLLILQPAFGLGWAASKTPNPAQARLRSLLNHTAFGAGIYFFGLLVSRWLWGV